jgi:hypothetical protein
MSKVITVSLVDLLRQCRDWVEVESLVATYPYRKAEAWHLLSTKDESPDQGAEATGERSTSTSGGLAGPVR